MVAMSLSPEIINLIDEIKEDRVHGASELARQAARVFRIAVERSRAASTGAFLREQREVGEGLMSARPAMAPVFNIISGLCDALAKAGEMDLDSARRFVIAKADEAINDSLRAVAQIAHYGAGLIADGDRVITHSYSSTVLAVLETAHTKHRSFEVVVTRSGPGCTGEAIARRLGQYGITVTFIDDAAMGLYLSTVDKAVVGADRICADGGVVNGIGTYLLAVAAERTGIPFYVLGETLKFDPRRSSDEVDLEEKEASEAEQGRLPPAVRVKNPGFDITPLELITGIVTENGLLTPEEVTGYLNRLKVAGADTPGLGSP